MSAKMVSEEPTQTVSPRQWIRLVVAYLLIPLILLICSGDLGWWQAWLYSLLILAAGIGGRMWAERRHPGITAERQNKESFYNAKDWDKVLAPLMAVSLVFPMVIVAGLDHRYNWSLEFPLWLSVAGFHFYRVWLCLRRMGISREPLLLRCGAHSDGSRACGV